MTINQSNTSKITKRNTLRTLVEVGFIMILFYSNLLMGEFTRSGEGFKKGLVWAIFSVFTPINFVIAVITACLAYFVVEYLRNKI